MRLSEGYRNLHLHSVCVTKEVYLSATVLYHGFVRSVLYVTACLVGHNKVVVENVLPLTPKCFSEVKYKYFDV